MSKIENLKNQIDFQHDIISKAKFELYRLEWLVKEEINPVLRNNISMLDLNFKATNMIAKLGIKTICDLVKIPPVKILNFPNCGFRTLKHISVKLKEQGIEYS